MKEALFGEIKKIESTGGHKVSPEELLRPLEGEGTFMRSFCAGCGLLAEIIQDEAAELAKRAGAELPDNPKNWYFETGRCIACDGQDETVRLLPVARG